jgi:hypothetical protein
VVGTPAREERRTVQFGPTKEFREEYIRWPDDHGGSEMVVLGLILIVLGFLVASLKVLIYIGVVLLIAGLVLNLVPLGGRTRRWY